MKTQYEELIKTDTTELIDVTGIQKEQIADYYKIQAAINYKDTASGEKKSQEMELYFDRFNGQYFANFDNLRQYRQHYWNYEEGREMCMFEQDQVKETTTKLNQAFLSGDINAAKELAADSLKETLTEEQWNQWQAVITSAGTYSGAESPAEISLDYVTKDGKRTGQLLREKWTVTMSDGTFTVEAVLGEDLLFQSIQLS